MPGESVGARNLILLGKIGPLRNGKSEQATQRLGREMFARMPMTTSRIWQRRWWDDQLLAWSMQHESLKVELFRFVDVLRCSVPQRPCWSTCTNICSGHNRMYQIGCSPV